MIGARFSLGIFCGCLVLFSAYLFGIYSALNGIWPVETLRIWKRAAFPVNSANGNDAFDTFDRLIFSREKQPVACPKQEKGTWVFLILGQSNAANHAGQKYQSLFGRKILNFSNGQCFEATSPLLGSTGQWGEPWTLLANKLVQGGFAENIILWPVAIGDTRISQWIPGGEIYPLLLSEIVKGEKMFHPTHVFWLQGESDLKSGTSEVDYRTSFSLLKNGLRMQGITAPLLFSISSLCDREKKNWLSNPVADAQRNLTDAKESIYLGVNSDALLTDDDKYDGCHWSASGIQKITDEYVRRLVDLKDK